MADIHCNKDPDHESTSVEDIRIMKRVVDMQQRGLQFFVLDNFKGIRVEPGELMSSEDLAFMDENFGRILMMLMETYISFSRETTHELRVEDIDALMGRKH